MFKRFLVSASQPKNIATFLKDKLPYVFLYILFLSIVAVLPNIFTVSTQNNFSKSVTKNMENAFYHASLESHITEYKLSSEKLSLVALTDTYSVGIHDDVIAVGFVFNFKEDHIEFHMGPINKRIYSYEALNLESLNFSMRSKEDKDKLNQALQIIYKDVRPIISSSTSISLIMSELMLGILFILISVWSYSYSIPKLKVRYRFVMASYSYTIYFVFVLLASLYGMVFLRFIGIFLAFRFMRTTYFALISQRKEDSIV